MTFVNNAHGAANMHINYTVFADLACTEVKDVHQLYGEQARKVIQAFRDVCGEEPKAGVLYREVGARVDWVSA
jgi:hypothetical protein